MATHVALLRGINVGTAQRVAMPALRAMAKDLGYADVSTHLNSGNLLLSTGGDAGTLQRRLEAGIQETFGLQVDVVVRTVDQLVATLAASPFPEGDPSRVVVAFLAGPPAQDAAGRIAALAAEDEPFLLAEQEVHVHFGHGQADSKLAAALPRLLDVPTTVRNLRTLTTLAKGAGIAGIAQP